MPRRPRVTIPEIPLHIIQRGNNRKACFMAEEDYGFYLDWLREYARSSGCAIHAYVLMTNHVHLLLTPKHKASAGNMMKLLGQRYVQYMNRSRVGCVSRTTSRCMECTLRVLALHPSHYPAKSNQPKTLHRRVFLAPVDDC